MPGETNVTIFDGCAIIVLTPASRGAVATIAIEGTRAAELVSQLFRPLARRDRRALSPGEIIVGHWQVGNNPAEEIVVARRGDSVFELNCHGGTAAGQAIVRELVERGAVEITVEEWLGRQGLDTIQSDARLALSKAPTARVAGILLDQYRGAWSRAVQDLLSDLRQPDSLESRVRPRLHRLLELAPVGFHLVTPWRVVIVGPPNAGKSSLVNAMLGYQRAIVFDEPGTTRDLLIASTAIEGWAIELIDTAGLRHSSDPVEARGVELAESQIDTCDLAVAATDSPDGQCDSFLGDIVQRFPPEKILWVATKCDLGYPDSARRWDVMTSAVTGEGLEDLLRAIVQRLVPRPPEPHEAVPFTSTQVQFLQAVLHEIDHGDTQAAIDRCERTIARLSTFRR